MQCVKMKLDTMTVTVRAASQGVVPLTTRAMMSMSVIEARTIALVTHDASTCQATTAVPVMPDSLVTVSRLARVVSCKALGRP